MAAQNGSLLHGPRFGHSCWENLITSVNNDALKFIPRVYNNTILRIYLENYSIFSLGEKRKYIYQRNNIIMVEIVKRIANLLSNL